MKFVVYTFSVDGITGRDMLKYFDRDRVSHGAIHMVIDNALVDNGDWPIMVCECCADALIKIHDVKIYQIKFCELCDTDMVICPTCGNNCCNGGYGEVNDMPCQDCPMAYKLWHEHIDRE
jgi:hypothetical protein